METLVEALNALSAKGYVYDLKASGSALLCSELQVSLQAHELYVDEVHRFEGETDPADESAVYAVRSLDSSIKGLVVVAYGVYASEQERQIVELLEQRRSS